VDFRILGPMEVVDDGRPVAIRRGKEQALLAYLLLHPNQVVPSERLIDQLWGEKPPATAAKILQNAVSHLRKQLGEGRLLTREPGYQLQLHADELDADRFQHLARQGQPHQALALWRGTPLVELQDERFADDARRQLEDHHANTLEDRIDHDLQNGKTSELIPELEHLTNQHPLRERLHAQLMLALYRSGRQADALDHYQHAHTTLQTQLGLQPNPNLQHLQQQILNHDPTLTAPASTAQPPRHPPPPRLRRRRRRRTAFAIALALLAALATGLVFAFRGGSSPLVVNANSLVAVNPRTNQIVGVTPVGAGPRGAAVTAKTIWVANSGDGTVSEVDARSLKLIRNIGIGAQATEIAVAAGAVWVATGLDNTVVELDARTGGTLQTFRFARDIDSSTYAIAAGNGKVWAVSGSRLVAIDPRSGTIVSGRDPLNCCASLRDVAVGAGAAWIADLGQIVVRISESTATSTGTTKLEAVPTAITVGYGSVWTAGAVSGRLLLWRIDPSTLQVTQTVTLSTSRNAGPYGAYGFLATVDVAAGAGAIWATNFDTGSLIRVDPDTGAVTNVIHIGHHPRGLAVGPHRIWVTVN
jgi:DNA-binding SARP family transcriptional activator/DNA-binding beta-propeller fold protein YncE